MRRLLIFGAALALGLVSAGAGAETAVVKVEYELKASVEIDPAAALLELPAAAVVENALEFEVKSNVPWEMELVYAAEIPIRLYYRLSGTKIWQKWENPVVIAGDPGITCISCDLYALGSSAGRGEVIKVRFNKNKL